MIQNALKALRAFFPDNTSITLAEITAHADFLLSSPIFKAVDKEQLIREAELFYNIRVEEFKIIEDNARKMPWIADKKATIEWGFWHRYRDYLETKKNFASVIINELDRLTDKILDGTFDPTAKIQIGKRGLVVGQVQSGKTSNYTGLICKAADAGFKFIIVLAGIHNNLRSQTQLRLDEGFLGFDTQHQRVFSLSSSKFVGVGESQTTRTHIAHSITSSLDKGDFSTAAFNSLGLNFATPDVIIAVVKKNTTVLRNLHSWLKSQTQTFGDKQLIREKSLLLIDDEADNASINTSKNSVTAINNHIRNILNLFEKNAYIGYTATPFANVFIPVEEQKDIFPRDFIINLPAPSNYVGPEKVFGFSPLQDDKNVDFVLPMIYKIEDGEQLISEKEKKAPKNSIELPNSLKLAIKTFILTCAIRCVRGQEKAHNSMLIHVSRYNTWQNYIFELVQDTFDIYRRGIEMNDTETYEEFRQVFEGNIPDYKNFVQVSTEILHSSLSNLDAQIQVHTWEDVKTQLYKASSKIQVRKINGGSKEVLDYFEHKNGLSVIAIGGDKLSRGLTLEGLSVSYFLRASKMYDTLMQMGRWFGYRGGYVDLCRLFTTRELNEWFCIITAASEELRNEFDYMHNVAGATPEKYALKVRTHPGLLQITASNKFRDVEYIKIAFRGTLTETYTFVKNPQVMEENFRNTYHFIESLGENDAVNFPKKYVWRNLSAKVIKDFLSLYDIGQGNSLKKSDPKILIDYINEGLKHGELNNWSVALISNSQAEPNKRIDYTINGLVCKVGLTLRTQDENCSTAKHSVEEIKIYHLIKSHIISPDHEYIDIEANIIQKHLEKESIKQQKKVTNLSGQVVREEIRSPNNPLLIIYSLDPKGADMEEELNNTPIIGYAISFSGSGKNYGKEYAIQKLLLPFYVNDDYDTDDINPNYED
ncbi:MAG: endonuclease [Cytophagales bacterium]|nr:MAG: endonuclease [Cytophagales bacterium]